MKIIVIVFMLALLIVACSVQSGITGNFAAEIGDSESADTPESGEPAAELDEDSVAEVDEVVDAPENDVAALVKTGTRTSYHYFFNHKARDEFGNYHETADYEVFVVGDKVKKAYISPVRLDKGLFYDQMYLDNTAKTAFATCIKRTVLCEPSFEKVYRAEYEELPFTAIDILQGVPPEAKSLGNRALYGRSALLIEYGNERLYIDTHFGLPLKHQVFKVEEGQEIILEESTFTRLSDALDSDVTVPEEFVLVE